MPSTPRRSGSVALRLQGGRAGQAWWRSSASSLRADHRDGTATRVPFRKRVTAGLDGDVHAQPVARGAACEAEAVPDVPAATRVGAHGSEGRPLPSRLPGLDLDELAERW